MRAGCLWEGKRFHWFTLEQAMMTSSTKHRLVCGTRISGLPERWLNAQGQSNVPQSMASLLRSKRTSKLFQMKRCCRKWLKIRRSLIILNFFSRECTHWKITKIQLYQRSKLKLLRTLMPLCWNHWKKVGATIFLVKRLPRCFELCLKKSLTSICWWIKS